MMNIPVVVEKGINAPVKDVFRQMTDIDNWTEMVSGIVAIETLTDGPLRVGSRWIETRIMFGKEASEEMEVTEFRPDTAYTVEANSCGTRYRTEISLRESETGTIARMNMQIKPLTLIAKLMVPLGWMMSGMLKKCLLNDLSDIKMSIEGGDATSPLVD